MKKKLLAICLAGLMGLAALTGCSRSAGEETTPAETALETTAEPTEAETSGIKVIENAGEDNDKTISVRIVDKNNPALPGRVPEKVRGIYISGPMAGSPGLFQDILDDMENTEINTVVIDLKNDEGRITCDIDTPIITEIGACKNYVQDIEALIKTLKDRGLYVIARVVAFRDPYLAEKKPEWSLHTADGSLYRDKQGMAWVDPYCKEVWDYLVEVGTAAKEVGFDEVQFDYIRFSTDSTMKNVVFDEEVTQGRSKTDVITEFCQYAYENLASQGLFVSADVFGTIIGSEIDANAVGQIYTDMAKHLDYICPMVYPSHYGPGNFGLEYPDKQPYETILAAMQKSKTVMDKAADEDDHIHNQAIVRPWLQDFTASYLGEGKYITYGYEEVQQQIQAVLDAGYDEWMLWSAANRYHLHPAGEAAAE
ncbi:MAG: sugar fermentation stimulation protein [Lachnoclostridium sp.]|nr:sugar fermentation stimulation protein [Lachnoclostridium sp.]